jgi:hypothetical protein
VSRTVQGRGLATKLYGSAVLHDGAELTPVRRQAEAAQRLPVDQDLAVRGRARALTTDGQTRQIVD